MRYSLESYDNRQKISFTCQILVAMQNTFIYTLSEYKSIIKFRREKDRKKEHFVPSKFSRDEIYDVKYIVRLSWIIINANQSM